MDMYREIAEEIFKIGRLGTRISMFMKELGEVSSVWMDSEISGNINKVWKVYDDEADIALSYTIRNEGVFFWIELFVNGNDIANREIKPLNKETTIDELTSVIKQYVVEVAEEAGI